MSVFRKLAAVLLSAVMIVCAFGITASAANISDMKLNAKNAYSGHKYSLRLKKSGNHADYIVKPTKDGSLKITIRSEMKNLLVYVYDSKGDPVTDTAKKVNSGTTSWENSDSYFSNQWGKDGTYRGTLTYTVKKGTYYIRFERFSFYSWDDGGTGDITFTVDFPSPAVEVTGMSVYMKAGSKLQFAPTTSVEIDNSINIKWSSSRSSVASVNSNGVVTAKKKGTAVITAIIGDSKTQIVIKVK